MKKIVLCPFVFKVKGAKNYAFFDLLNGRLFNVDPDGGDVEELKEYMLKNELAYDTEYVIPKKLHMNISEYKSLVSLREVQIRTTGKCDLECDDCGRSCQCFKSEGDMTMDRLKKIVMQLKYIPTAEVLVTGGNPLLKPDLLEYIKKELHVEKYKILTREKVGNVAMKRFKQMGFDVIFSHRRISEITETKLVSDAFSFFYNKEFNPCWGNTVAFDTDGSIKPCLWSDEVVGNAHGNDIKTLIGAGKFNKFWELKKDNIEVCKKCEYRYGCYDCRVSILNQGRSLTDKTNGCSYNPDSGRWEEYSS